MHHPTCLCSVLLLNSWGFICVFFFYLVYCLCALHSCFHFPPDCPLVSHVNSIVLSTTFETNTPKAESLLMQTHETKKNISLVRLNYTMPHMNYLGDTEHGEVIAECECTNFKKHLHRTPYVQPFSQFFIF